MVKLKKGAVRKAVLFFPYLCDSKYKAMAENYSLNLDNVLDFLTYGTPKGEYMHYWLGITDNRAEQVANHAYDIVWDAIEGKDGDITPMELIVRLFKEAKRANYNDNELTLYLYWGFSEMEGHFNPTIEINMEIEGGDLPSDFSTN